MYPFGKLFAKILLNTTRRDAKSQKSTKRIGMFPGSPQIECSNVVLKSGEIVFGTYHGKEWDVPLQPPSKWDVPLQVLLLYV